MNFFTITIIINILVSLVFIISALIFYQIQKSSQRNLIGSSEITQNIVTLDDYFKKMEVFVIQKKISQIKQPKKVLPVQKIKGPLVIQRDEELIIKDGESLLKIYEEELSDPYPKNKIEYKRDLDLLLNTISDLESLDAEHYGSLIDEPADMGKGMLYDSISRKLKKIIEENHFNELPFIQAEKLELIAFNKIKRLEHEDFEKTLDIMKDLGIINQIIEIGPFIKLITFQKKIKVSNPEKVIISLYAEDNIRKTEEIQNRTLWKPSYLNSVLKKLQSKEIIEFDTINQEININGLISSSERAERIKKLEEIIKKKTEKEKDSKKLQSYRQQQLMALNRKKSRKQQESLKSQQEILLAEAKVEAKKISKIHREEAEKLSKIEDEERIKLIKNGQIKEKAQENLRNQQIEELSLFEDQPEENKKILNEINKIFKNVGKITGGIITLSTLLKILKNGQAPKIKKIDLLNLIDILKQKEIIIDEYSFSGVIIYIFEDIVLDDDMIRLMKQFIVNEDMDEEDISVAIDDWSTKKIKRIIKRFEDQNLIKKDKKNHYYLPGLINAKK
ncbi:MAG: hypothetical protein ACTSWX_12800 [Promethearchaeota archaeon]